MAKHGEVNDQIQNPGNSIDKKESGSKLIGMMMMKNTKPLRTNFKINYNFNTKINCCSYCGLLALMSS